MKLFYKSKIAEKKERFCEKDYTVLDYEELLMVNGAGGSSGSPSGPSGSSSSQQNNSNPTQTSQSTQTVQKKDLAQTSNGVSVPVGKTWNDGQNVSSTWGARESIETKNGSTQYGHNGMDYAAPEGTRINAVKDGVITKVETNPNNSTGYGIYVEITHSDGTHSLYGHQSATNVTVGQSVCAGEQIGQVGSTGKATGSHLHFAYDGNGDGKYSRTDNCDNPAALLYGDGN